MKNLRSAMKQLEDQRNFNPLFVELVRRDLVALAENIEDCQTRLYELSGDRENMLHGLIECVRMLNAGDLYAVVTVPSLWSSSGLGLKGRFFTANLLAAMRGAIVKRVFIVTTRELSNQRIHEVFDAQKLAQDRLDRLGYGTTTGKSIESEGCYIGYNVVTEAEKDRVIRHGLNFGLVRIGKAHTRIAIDYEIEGRAISSEQKILRLTNVRLWHVESEERLKEYTDDLNGYLQTSTPISEWRAL